MSTSGARRPAVGLAVLLAPVACALALGAASGLGPAKAAGEGPRLLKATPPAPVRALRAARDGVFAEARDGRRFAVRIEGGRIAFGPAGAARAGPARKPGMLADGEVTTASGHVRAAWLIDATRRYRHGVLGDDVEAAGLAAELADGRVVRFRLDEGSVFEDRRVRLWDVTGDGRAELVVVRSYLERGAALAVFAAGAAGVRHIAEAPPIGRPHRWLNPVGAADFDGDGRIEIAAVITPHIGGILTLYRLEGTGLRETYAERGFSNHAIGWRELGMAAVVEANRDGIADLVVPGAARLTVRAVTFAGGRFREVAAASHTSEVATNILAADVDGVAGEEVTYGLADGTVVVWVFRR